MIQPTEAEPDEQTPCGTAPSSDRGLQTGVEFPTEADCVEGRCGRLIGSGHAAEGVADGDMADPRVASMLPAQLLQPGEIIILLIKPSPWYILLESLAALFVIGVLVALGLIAAAKGCWGINQTDVVLVGVGVAGVRLFWQFLEWLSRVYVLTDRRVIRVKGVIRVQVFECQLKKIQHTVATYSLRERLVGLGTIHFATAGTAGIEATWSMVARPMEVHQIVVQAINRYR